MNNKNNQKKEPWRLVVALLSVAFIIYMWTTKNMTGIYATMPAEQLAPMLVTTVVVTLVKVLGFTAGILFIKWLASKFKH